MIHIIAEDQEAADEQEISAMADRFVEDNIPSEEEAKAILEERAEVSEEEQ